MSAEKDEPRTDPIQCATNQMTDFITRKMDSLDEYIAELKEERWYWRKMLWDLSSAPPRPSRQEIAEAQPGLGDLQNHFMEYRYPSPATSYQERLRRWNAGPGELEDGEIQNLGSEAAQSDAD